MRTKTQIRNSKSKGASFEYDCQESLQAIYPDIYRTSERGFQLQYDLRSDGIGLNAVFECKRLKHIDWNQAVKYFKKLQSVAPKLHYCYLLFKSNRQPCLVMFKNGEVIDSLEVTDFQSLFGTPFIKHKSTRSFQKIGKNLGESEK